MKTKLDISHLVSSEQEAMTAILARAKIGSLSIESVRLDGEYLRASWDDCEGWSPAEVEVGYPGDPACPFYPRDNAIPRAEWCPSCQHKDNLRDSVRKARRRLRDAVEKYEKEKE